jgi:hypothetical protein
VTSQDYTLQVLLTYLKISGQNWNKHSPLLKHTQNCRETGGKDFIIAHSSANPKQVATGMCVVHLNFKVKMFSSFKTLKSLWQAIKEQIITDVKSMKMGSPEDFSNFLLR